MERKTHQGSEFHQDYETHPPETIYNRHELRKLVESDQWQYLQGNLSSPDLLTPQQLTFPQIEQLIRHVIDPHLIQALGDKTHHQLDIPEVDLPGLGTLSPVDTGESALCFQLQTPDHKKMAILTEGYQGPAQIPNDPRLYLLKPGLGKNFYKYADARTYLQVPMTIDNRQTLGVRFQEWAGDRSLPLGDPRIWLARRRVHQYLSNHPRHLQLAQAGTQELTHPRHFLATPGRFLPAVIDIPVEEIIS